MNKYSLSKYKSSVYLDDFNTKKIEIIPSQEPGLYYFTNGEKIKITEKEQKSRGICTHQLHHLYDDVEHGYCEIGPKDRRFGVRLETENGEIKDGVLDLAKKIISQIVEMDAEVRAKQEEVEANLIKAKLDYLNEDFEEALAYIDIQLDDVELHYVATTCNTEWGVSFYKDANEQWCYGDLG